MFILQAGGVSGSLVPSEVHSGPRVWVQREDLSLLAYSQSQVGNVTSGQVSEASPGDEFQ